MSTLHEFAVGKKNKKKPKQTTPVIFVRSAELQGKEKLLADDATAGSREEEEEEALPDGFELTPTHGQVHIPMSTKAAEMCLHATPTVSRAASNDHHMLTFRLLPALEHMEDESKTGQVT